MGEIFSTSHHTDNTFGLWTNSSPRPKHLFIVSFSIANPANNALTWANTISFMVKSTDRPTVNLQVEEMNQYNKKRQVVTGYKMNPLHMTFYDTKDSLALQMWNQYIKQYIGDFYHDYSTYDYSYDVVAAQMKDSVGTGYGFAPQSVSNSTNNDNQQFFFDKISIYQIYGGNYVAYDLLNPKIASFDPENLSYDDSSMAMIMMSLVYEAAIYRNDGVPLSIYSDAVLSSLFSSVQMQSEMVDYDGIGLTENSPISYVSSILNTAAVTASFVNQVIDTTSLTGLTNIVGAAAGSLSNFGNYVFGTLNDAGQTINSAVTDIANVAATNTALATNMNLTSTQTSNVSPPTIVSSAVPSNTISAQQYDIVNGAVQTASQSSASNTISQQLTAGLTATGLATGTSATSNIVESTNGILLTSPTYAMMNLQSTTSQIGYNASDVTQNG